MDNAGVFSPIGEGGGFWGAAQTYCIVICPLYPNKLLQATLSEVSF